MQENPPIKGVEQTIRKRPASHYWVIGIFGFITMGFAAILARLLIDRAGIPFSLDRILLLSMCALAVLSLLSGGRRQWAYYVTSLVLTAWLLQASYTWFWYLYHFMFQRNPVSAPNYHPFETNQPLVTQQTIFIGRQLLFNSIGVSLFAWLCLRFVFGKPSRKFFGFENSEPALPRNQMSSGGATDGSPG